MLHLLSQHMNTPPPDQLRGITQDHLTGEEGCVLPLPARASNIAWHHFLGDKDDELNLPPRLAVTGLVQKLPAEPTHQPACPAFGQSALQSSD